MSGGPLAALAARAAARARETGRPVLASVVEPVADLDVDALDALAQLATASADVDRMYWTRPADGFELAAAGAAAVLAPDAGDRFAAVDDAWRALAADALLDDASRGATGTGPLLLGGFSFDDAGPRSARWRGFPRARLTLPAALLTTVNGARWLTTSVVVQPDGNLSAVAPTIALGARLRGASGRPRQAAASPVRIETSDARPAAEWRAVVEDAVAAIRAGALDKVVLAREVRAHATSAFDVAATVARLRAAYRDCYVFAIWRGDRAFVGASPERLVRLDGRAVRASSLAGSIRRGATPGEDAALVAQLRGSAKDRVEHAVVRAALLRSLGDLCDDVGAGAAPGVLTLPQIHHLHTDVRGTLREGHSIFDLVGRLHPTPAVGGEPRAAALEFLAEHERLDRGWYAAPVGWAGRDAAEFAVGLRSALVTGADASLYAGCGVVADSDAERELAESALKLRPMELALSGAAGVAAHDGAA